MSPVGQFGRQDQLPVSLLVESRRNKALTQLTLV